MTPLSPRERRVLEELERQLPPDTTPPAGFATAGPRLDHRSRHVRLGVLAALCVLAAGLTLLFVWAGAAALLFLCATVALAVLPLWWVHRHISRAGRRAGGGPGHPGRPPA
jgi:Flp pilus assembly protein TadB